MLNHFRPQTTISLTAGRWHMNGKITYPGARAEGLLMNVRMANAVFEDLNRLEIPPAEITGRFLARLPEYVSSGVRAFTIGLQGGYPGYKGAVNSAFEPDGSLRDSYLERVGRVIEACDRLGAAVILNCYYQLQTGVLQDDAAVHNGIRQAVRWLRQKAYTNVLLEVANEFGQEGFSHASLREAAGMVELIHLAQREAPGLLVSASRQGELGDTPQVWQASDFVLIHLNRVPLEEYPARLAALKMHGKPVVCSEDRKTGEEGVLAAEACVENGCSWGLNVRDVNQYNPPFRFEGAADDALVYARLGELTGGATTLAT